MSDLVAMQLYWRRCHYHTETRVWMLSSPLLAPVPSSSASTRRFNGRQSSSVFMRQLINSPNTCCQQPAALQVTLRCQLSKLQYERAHRSASNTQVR
jgi:hypothetical protein